MPGAECGFPPVQGGGESPLPALLTGPGLGRPAQCQVAAWLEPAEDPQAARSRSSRWNALPMTASSKYSGGAPSVSALDTTGRKFGASAVAALARTTSIMSGSWSTAHTSANQRRSGKASWPVPQARSSSGLAGDLGAAGQIRGHRCWIWQSVSFVSCCCSPEQVGCEPHLVSHLGSSSSSTLRRYGTPGHSKARIQCAESSRKPRTRRSADRSRHESMIVISRA